MTTFKLAAEFHEHLRALAQASAIIDPLGAEQIRRMLERRQGIFVAQDALKNPLPQASGFHRMKQLGRLDLTIESAVLEPRFRILFTQAEIDKARSRVS